MYPLTLVRLSRKRKISVQLNDGSTVTGQLLDTDVAMNIRLRDSTIAYPDGRSVFARTCLVRGQSICFVRTDHKLMEKQALFD